jgi:hypothetical protein
MNLTHSRQDAVVERRVQHLRYPDPSLSETLMELVETLAGIVAVIAIVVFAAGFIG